LSPSTNYSLKHRKKYKVLSVYVFKAVQLAETSIITARINGRARLPI
jgi:hypothetical protein